MNRIKSFLLIISLVAYSSVSAQNLNLSNGVVFDGEPYLAINPNNSQHIVVAWMGWVDFTNKFKIKTRTSFDGGQTWSAKVELPHPLAGYTSADPSLDFDHNGDVHICFIDFTGTTPPCTGGIFISKSLDGGLSWEAPVEVINTSYDGTKWPIDRPWMMIDKSSSPNQGNIYVTTFNLNRLNPAFNPYLSVSTDGGLNFDTRYVDSTDYLAGSLNPYPMCSPTLSSSGVFYGAYPSYVVSQSSFIQTFLATSNDAGNNIDHNLVKTFPANTFPDDTLAKKGPLLLSDPSDPDHLAFIYLSRDYGDMDVFLLESFDQGNFWGAPVRVNDDPVSNDRMQDLLWADFDADGDLVVAWRDRRNAPDSTFTTSTEIWGAFRKKDSTQFESNFPITNQLINYDTDMGESGNDFMCVKLQNDTISSVWGDPRDGELNIWFQRNAANGTVLSITKIDSGINEKIEVFPNPVSSILTVKGLSILKVEIVDLNGKTVLFKEFQSENSEESIDLTNFPDGTYIIKVFGNQNFWAQKIVKK